MRGRGEGCKVEDGRERKKEKGEQTCSQKSLASTTVWGLIFI